MSRLSEKLREQIKPTFQRTGSIRATAKELGITRKAVRNQLKALNRTITKAPKAIPRKSKLDPYNAKIRYLCLEKHLSAVRILEEIKDLGYTGGYSILKEFLTKLRPRALKRPRPPIDHPPGEEGQMDWSPHRTIFASQEAIVHTGSIALCFSRWLFSQHFPDETIESVILLHKGAFAELKGVPHTMTYDNMTTVGRHINGQIWINPVFKRFADEYGFRIVILPPGAKERHGVVERPFHYIEHNFLAGREFTDLADLNSRSTLWRHHTANVRIHGTLRERPIDRLERERPYLKPLPSYLTDTFLREVDRLIHTDFCVAIDTNRYSANPNLVGHQAKVRLYRDHLEIWVGNQLDCRHPYLTTRNDRHVLPEHLDVYKTMTGQRQLLEKAFLRLGQEASSYYQGLKTARGGAAGYHLSRILTFADRYGTDIVAGAMAHAARHGAYNADAILRIIKGRPLKQNNPLPEAPENVRQWLRACAVEKNPPSFYDQLVTERKDTKEEENK